MQNFVELWVYLSSAPLFGLTATLAVYVLAQAVSLRAGHAPWANPVMLSVAVLAGVLLATGTAYPTYFAGAQFIHFLLGPAVVALGWPLWQRRAALRARSRAFLAPWEPTWPEDDLTRAEMIAKMVGRSIENEYPERPNNVGSTLMEVRSINTRKLHDVSFKLNKGEILGLVGLVGAGRTEIVRALFGADKTEGHQILIDGAPIRIKNPNDAKKAGLGFVPEDRKLQGLVLPFSVEANISMASFQKFTRFGFLNKAKEAEIGVRQSKALAVKTPSTKTPVKNLSGGNQQKCIIGRWLENEPRIFIMDEPTRGIDVGAKYEIYMLMKEIAEKGGAVILISSELPEVLNMSNRVLTIFEGRITGEFDPQQASADEIMSAALGMAGSGAKQ